MSNHQLAEKLHKPTITIIETRKMRSSFTGNTWDADLQICN